MSIMRIVLTLAIAFAIVVVCEYLWNKKILRGEDARKALHVVLGVYLAFVPYFLPWREVQMVTTIGFLFVFFMRYSRLFHSMYEISRKSWGEILVPFVFMVLAFMEPTKLLFAAVLLHVALADGIAALIGVRYGKTSRYKVFGYQKSVVGTAAFFATSMLIMTWVLVAHISPVAPVWLVLLVVPLVTAMIENIAIYGVDNVLIPLTVVSLFSLFKLT